jgi:5-methylcytosine-specific restriction enzyme subunit McrC
VARAIHQGLLPGYVTVEESSPVLRGRLRESAQLAIGGHVEAQSRHHLDVAGKVLLKPDIVWRFGGTIAAVVDAKYKAEKPSGYPNADLYQLLAYCTVLGLKVGHLVYAAGNEEPVRHRVRQAGTEILCHALDLNCPPADLLAEVRVLAGSVAGARHRMS